MLTRIGTLLIVTLCLLPGPGHAADMPDPNQLEQAKNILADQVREQGHPCDKAIAASHDEAESRPDEPAWILRCSNGTYRIRVRADMAAYIEPISGTP